VRVNSLKKTNLEAWLYRLSEGAELYVPQRRQGGDVVLGPWGAGPMVLDYGRLTESPKRLLYPQVDRLFRFEGYRVEALFDERDRVLFGLRPCDTAAIAILDDFFRTTFSDPHYLARREHLALIVLACSEPEETCFCTSTATGFVAETGYDVQLIDLGEAYLVQAATGKGTALVEAGGEFFNEAPENWQHEFERWREEVSGKFQVAIDIEGAARLVRTGAEPEGFWESVAERCLLCGGCAFICPTCTCFEMADVLQRSTPVGRHEVTANGLESPPKGVRTRLWDSCVFAGFTREASGHNPRDEHSLRCAHRYQHKLGQPDAPGEEAPAGTFPFRCVGCGRCVETCLSRLGMIEIVRQLTEGQPSQTDPNQE